MKLKIGEVAERLGTTPRTLRFYEEQGLVEPSYRSDGGTRYYSGEDVARFAAVMELAALEVPLAEIGALASVRPDSRSGDEASRKVDDLLGNLGRELAEHKRRITRMQQDLARAQELVRRCHGCDVKPTRSNCANCKVAEDLECARVLQVVWDQAVG